MLNNKGVSFSIIPIIALIGVLGLAIWAGYQLSVGSNIQSQSGISTQDTAADNLQRLKDKLTEDLSFSASEASLDIAKNGGTGATTYWYCSGTPIPPEPDEVEYAMSTLTLGNLNGYISTLREPENPIFIEMEPVIPDYTCVGIFEPSSTQCDNQNSVNCERFGVTASDGPDGKIEVRKPSYASDDDDLEAYVNDNRFYWLYYRLYNNFDLLTSNANILAEITPGCGYYVLDNGELISIEEYERRVWQPLIDDGCVDQNRQPLPIPPAPFECPSRISAVLADIAAKRSGAVYGFVDGSFARSEIENRLREFCNNAKNLFDNYVTCSWEIQCFSSGGGECLASNCERSTNPPICNTAPSLSLQGQINEIWGGSTRFKISFEDSKFNIYSNEREPQHMVWNVNGAINFNYAGCPLLVYVGPGGSSGGSQLPPAPGS
ncbi:MAG: hypothetical protein QXY45_00985 [Candidatus Aenigmatarchaeota archaeon]